jgi:hypothetical protein
MSEALIDALMADDVERLAKLLAAGENPNAPFTPRYDFTPLQAAVSALRPVREGEAGASIDEVVLLLRYGADVNAWDEPRTTTPLLTAAEINHLECLRILLAAGADPNVRSDVGETPLRFCVYSGSLEMVRLLLQCGADLYRAGGTDGMNPLGLAATALNLDMVRLLLSYGTDPNVPDNDRMTALDHLRWFPHASKPETPEKWERLQEVRRLLGAGPLAVPQS